MRSWYPPMEPETGKPTRRCCRSFIHSPKRRRERICSVRTKKGECQLTSDRGGAKAQEEWRARQFLKRIENVGAAASPRLEGTLPHKSALVQNFRQSGTP